jgi:hypothetical protein
MENSPLLLRFPRRSVGADRRTEAFETYFAEIFEEEAFAET